MKIPLNEARHINRVKILIRYQLIYKTHAMYPICIKGCNLLLLSKERESKVGSRYR